MKKLLTIVLFVAGLVLPAAAQLHSVQFFGAGEMAVNKRLGIATATGYGGGLRISYSVFDDLFVTIDVAYAGYAIEQDNEVQKWGWSIWERRYRNWVNIYSSDTANFRSSVVSVQTMESVPVTVKTGYPVSVTDDIWLTPVIGAGIEFYTRKLYHEETWTRKYPQDNYQFTYSYHNFAPYKYGNPVFGVGGLKGSVHLSTLITIESEILYKAFLDTKGMFGYDNFPFNSALTVHVGIGFKY